MEFEILTEFTGLADEAVATYITSARAAIAEIVALDAPTDEQIAQGEAIAASIDAAEAVVTERTEAATERAARFDSLRSRFSSEDAEDEGAEAASAEEDEALPEPVEAAVKPKKTVAAIARKVPRPVTPSQEAGRVVITAAADVPEFATGSTINSMDEVGNALVNRMKGFGPPSGDGSMENLQHYGVAKFKMDFPKELTIDRGSDDMQVLSYAASEQRLPGNSLTAANGWCAPSETLYDLCTSETLDGLISVPEVNVARGGIKFTSGPDFSTIFSSVGFQQTEAQAIAGTPKTCFEVPCPSFTDVRLDAIGLCIKAPILTNSAYPELVQRWLSGSMVAHQHKVSASVISKMVTAAGTANAVRDFGGSAATTLANLELLADRLRQKYKLSLTQTLEVILPFWIKGNIRSDLSLRTGQETEAITDQQIMAHFSARHLNVQFVYNWQELTDYATTEGYPATYQALIYPSGTFVKGVSDVITLNAVYDAASLATNIYTALFFEQGLLVAKMCHEAMLVTLAVCAAGRTGIANVAECGTGA